ncbi:hypothetical protein TRFO_34618 [Tritrichomonas foetus]|uniref:Uncharacterized protein n=1 Tax=Tritrichomonas foetus TaxID=1144522 RepID=A0A1J4JKT4_9EUKA|nr:hypothetical protein TRFO_34618 [Tritrichomonas foetus]|eukprot:OHS99007.1 hypothetical protein TRFO_34618 [Tritrichomonas foetus]
MEDLQKLIANPELRTTKNLTNMNNVVKKAISDNSSETIKILANFLFSPESTTVLQTFGNQTRDNLRKSGLSSQFEDETKTKLIESFWESKIPNFTAAYNSIILCGKEFFFNSFEIAKLVKIFALYLISVKTDESYQNASKILENLFEFYQEPSILDSSSLFEGKFNDLFLDFTETNESSTFSILSSTILQIIKEIPSFDSSFSYIRTLSVFLCKIIKFDSISSLFSNDESKFMLLLKQFLDERHIFLLSCVIGRKLKNQEFCNFCFKKMTSLPTDQLSAVDRIFLYNGMNQITPFISSMNEFIAFYGESLLRDFDSSNNLITCALRGILQTLLKSCGKNGENNEKSNIGNEVSEQLMKFIEPLSYNSKLKTWLFPHLLKNIDSNSIPNDLLIEMAQDPSVGNFVRKCVKCVSKIGWKSLIDCCYDKAIQITKYDGNMIVLRPIIEPIFENQGNESIEYAFQKLHIDNNDKNQKILDTWFRFECLLSSPKSKWKISTEEIRSYIYFAIGCGNWDVRVGSFIVFTIAGFPLNEEDIEFIMNRFDEYFYFDSPKHIVQISSTFSDFIDRISSRSKTLKPDQSEQIMKSILNISCDHMIPSFISSHRQFAFDIASAILNKNIKLIISNLENVKSIVSLTNDSNSSLKASACKLLQKLFEIEEVKNHYSSEVESWLSFCSYLTSGKESIETIQPILEKVELTENWEEQCALFEQMVIKINSGKVPVNEIEEASEKLFNILLNTRVLAVTCRGQQALESITVKLPKSKLEEILDKWTNSLLQTLDHFDMENMRRSAALPYLALSILRLNTPDVMQTKHTIFEKLINALIDVIKTTENGQEATHSLNMVRAVLTDKVTSPLSEVILPSIFCSIFEVCDKIDCWDLVTAANLCIAAVIRKIKKKNISQEDSTEQSLLLEQFFNKMIGSRDSILSALKSPRPHLNYLATLTLSSFSSNITDYQLQELVIKHIGSRDSRRRRLAARATVSVTAQNDLLSLFTKIVSNLSRQSYNILHGQFMLLKEILLCCTINSLNIEPFCSVEFPTINISKIPPFMYDDMFYVFTQIGHEQQIPQNELILDQFYFDQVSLFLHRHQINQQLNVSGTVALLWRLTDERRYLPPTDFNDNLFDMIFTKSNIENESNNMALLISGLEFFRLHSPSQEKLKNHAELIVSLIKKEIFESHIVASLITLLKLAQPTQNMLNEIIPALENIAYDLREETTPVHIAVAELLPLLLFDVKGYLIALRLLMDDVPCVRTLTMKALSDKFDIGFSSEIILFNRLLKMIHENYGETGTKYLTLALLKWAKMISRRIDSDTHGEALTVIVDEFFFLRRISDEIQIDMKIDGRPTRNLLMERKKLVEETLQAIESLVVIDKK